MKFTNFQVYITGKLRNQMFYERQILNRFVCRPQQNHEMKYPQTYKFSFIHENWYPKKLINPQ